MATNNQKILNPSFEFSPPKRLFSSSSKTTVNSKLWCFFSTKFLFKTFFYYIISRYCDDPELPALAQNQRLSLLRLQQQRQQQGRVWQVHQVFHREHLPAWVSPALNPGLIPPHFVLPFSPSSRSYLHLCFYFLPSFSAGLLLFFPALHTSSHPLRLSSYSFLSC